jgi:flagellar biosynthesis anti-sigma factor FlgM
MKITGKDLSLTQGLFRDVSKSGQGKPPAGAGQSAPAGIDRVELSKTQKAQVAAIKAKVMEMSAVDQAKVEEIKRQVESKTYNVSGQLIAKGILKSQFLDTML